MRDLLTRYGGLRVTDIMQSIHEPLILRFVNEVLMGNERVAYLGPEGSYSHEVALQLFGRALLIPLKSISEVVKGVYQGEYGFGVIPIENNQAGVVGESMESLLRWDVHVNYAVDYRVTLCLAVNDGATIEDIREVYSHPHAINEAMNFISKLNVSINYTQSTSEALRMVVGHGHRRP